MLYASFRWPSAEVLTCLVRNAQSGQPRAIDELLAALRPSLLAFFQRRLSADLTEDLAQLALIRISGAVARIDPERADSYISTVARNVLRTAYRVNARDRARQGDSDLTELPAESASVDDGLEYAELVRAIHRTCLTQVQPGLREVAVGFLRGDSAAEIAMELDISPITVRTRMMRVRAILRRELCAYFDADAASSPEA